VIPKFERERYCVQQLAGLLQLSPDMQYRDPLKDYGRETGIDVIVVGGGLKIGFQVTEYDGGESVSALGAGRMRAAEKTLVHEARETGVYGDGDLRTFRERLPRALPARCINLGSTISPKLIKYGFWCPPERLMRQLQPLCPISISAPRF